MKYPALVILFALFAMSCGEKVESQAPIIQELQNKFQEHLGLLGQMEKRITMDRAKNSFGERPTVLLLDQQLVEFETDKMLRPDAHTKDVLTTRFYFDQGSLYFINETLLRIYKSDQTRYTSWKETNIFFAQDSVVQVLRTEKGESGPSMMSLAAFSRCTDVTTNFEDRKALAASYQEQFQLRYDEFLAMETEIDSTVYVDREE